MPKIFISYARDASHGENLAAAVQAQLQAAGFEVFRDVIGLKPGDVWYHKLEFELDSSDCMVLVVSEKVRTSKWVHNEVSMAEEIGIPVIPVLAEKVRHPLWLRHLQVLDFCVLPDWQKLLDAVVHHGLQIPPVPPFAKGGTLQPEAVVRDELASPFAKGGTRGISPPTWATTSAEDQYGRYADFVYQGINQRFRWIEPGTFWMGSPEDEMGRGDDETRHQVTLTKSYWLADTPCTQALWQAVMGSNPSYFTDNPNNPVECVSWDDVQKFTQKLNGLVSGLRARLPTEAQWEYACRAGTRSAYAFGDKLSSQQVNFDGNIGETTPVKSYLANAWGLYDMHGNVYEWCEDGYADYPAQPVSDPLGAGPSRVLRGGSWIDLGRRCRSARRSRGDPASRDNLIGFRLALGL